MRTEQPWEIGAAGALNLYWGANSLSQAYFNDPNALKLDSGAYVSLAGARLATAGLTLTAGATLHADGVFSGATPVAAEIDGPVANGGTMVFDGVEAASAQPQALVTGAVSGAGAIDINQDAFIEFAAGVAAGQTIAFGDNQQASATKVAGEETLKIDAATVSPTGAFAATVAGFRLGDAIDLKGFSGETNYSFNGSLLTISFASGGQASLTLSGVGADTGFSFASDGSGGTLITTAVSAKLAVDTGVSATDGLTMNSDLAGTGEAGATLTFTEAGKTLGTTVIGANGAWTFNPTGLADGVQTITASESNSGGDAEGASVTVALATHAPTVTASGSLSGLTSKTTDTITETAVAEAVGTNAIASVEVFDGATDLGAATLSGGTWAFTTKTLIDGAHNLSTVTTDAAGNSVTTMLTEVDVATHAPTVTASGSVSGLTSKTTDTITETAVAEAVGTNAIASVEVFDGATDLGAATLSGGTWTFTTKTLIDGAHNLSTVTTDAAGNSVTSKLTEVDVATQGPTVTASESVSGTTTQTSDTITATATAEAVGTNAIASVLVYDGTNQIGTATLSGGKYAFTASGLALGAHIFSLKTSDTVGNVTTTTLAPVNVVSSQGPTVTASESLSGLTNQTLDTITETATAGTGLTVKSVEVFDGTTDLGAATLTGGTWTFTTKTLTDGAHVLSTVTTDSAGIATSTKLAEVDVATKAPTVTASDSPAGLTNKTTDTITEAATAEAVGSNAIKSVEVYDGSMALGAATLTNGTWSFTTATLADGVHNLSTVTTDTAGNSVTTTLAAVDVATKAPTVTAGGSISGLTNKNIDVITETATAEAVGSNAIKSVEVYDGTTALGAATLANGIWSFTTAPLADGGHFLGTVTTDTAGNTTTTTVPEVTVATQKPVVTASQSVSGLTNKTTVTITETATTEAVETSPNASSVTVFDGATELGSATLSNGTWSFTTGVLADGAHNLSTVTTDAAGNVTTTTLAAVDVATQKPVVTASESVSGTTTATSDTITATATAESIASNAIASVEVYDGATALGAATLTNGQYVFTASNLALGARDFSLKTTDAAGNTTTTSLAPVTVTNAQPPTVSASETLSGLTDLTVDTITETATAATGLTIQSVKVLDGTAVLGSATLASGVWTFTTPTLVDGAHTLSTVTTDSAGGVTTTALAPVDVATQPPTVTASESVSGLTDKTSVTITGTAKAENVPGDSVLLVEVLNGATPLVTATLSATTGAFSYTASNLTDGVYDFDLVTLDAAGNETTTTLTPVDVATQKPVVSASQSLSGVTNKNVDTVSETATAEAVGTNAIKSVEVFDLLNGVSTDLGAATLTNGTWSLTTKALGDGVNTLSTVTTDTAGNVTSSTLTAVDIATQKPVVNASQSLSGVTNKNVDTVSETATAEAVGTNAIKSVEVFDLLNGVSTDLGAATLTNGTWSLTTKALGDGVNTLSTVTTDTAGNVTTSTLTAVDIATQKPVVSASQSLTGVTNKNVDTVSETATAEAVGTNAIKSVEVFDLLNGVSTDLGAATLTNGTWSLTTKALGDGVNTLSTVTTDTAGNETTTTLTPVDVATQKPVVNASQSLSGLTNKNVDTVSETATAEAVGTNAIKSVEVFDLLNGVSTDLGAATLTNGTWSLTTKALGDGVNTLSTVTTDTAGNVTTTTLTAVDVATQAPAVSVSELFSGLTTTSTTNTVTETATAEAVGANAIKSVEIYDLFNGVTTALGAATLTNGKYTFTTGTLAYGTHTLSTVTTDTAGNSFTTALTPDNVEPPPPKVTIALQTDSSNGKDITNNDALTGSGDPNATVSFTIDGVKVAQTATANASGVWSFTPSGLSQGAHTVMASETNGGGTGTASLTFTYDTIAPTVAITTPSAAVANTSETINGTGEAGTTVQLYDGANPLGSAVTVGANGQWVDTVTLLAGANAITAHDTDAANNVGVSAGVTLTLANQIVGQPSQFVLTGTSGADHIVVGAANIVVDTLGGADTVTLTNGAGQFHVIVGGGGSDTLDLSQTTGGASVDLATDTATGAEIGTDFVFNFSNIGGGGGAETLIGANGGGTIQAGSGADVMTGGAGTDTYSFLSPFGVDTVTNFVAAGAGHSTLVFDQSLFASAAAVEAATADTAAGAQISISPTESITLNGVTKATLTANATADFRFV